VVVALVSLIRSVDDPQPLIRGMATRLMSEIAIFVEFFMTNMSSFLKVLVGASYSKEIRQGISLLAICISAMLSATNTARSAAAHESALPGIVITP